VTTPGAYDIAPGMTALGGTAAGGAVFAGDSVERHRGARSGGTKKKSRSTWQGDSGEGKDVTLQGATSQVPAADQDRSVLAYWVLTTGVGASVPLF
jgi:hypothetical protein